MRFLLFLAFTSCFAAPVDFVLEVRPIFEKHCTECHGTAKRKSGLRLDMKAAALKGGDNHGPDILPGNAKDSPLIHFLTSQDKDEMMPPEGRLSDLEIDTIRRWIDEGAVWPEGVDGSTVEDLREHWSFKPLVEAYHQSIDGFVQETLRENGLALSPPTSRTGWLRRVSFDLTGLPPTAEEMAEYLADENQSNAQARAVDRLLASPRYGERWAQHWLDVVRYADTHGFEVNTERPNAWPYRDYVIRAFNEDTPYDQFIKEQLAGDTLGKDAATGFLVTASVLLPGQIGKDAASIRLARQDSLDEIVSNIGQTFLGLSLGCARCHDHKFDPISSQDYYAMQAFVAGVEYEDREIRTPEAEALKMEAAEAKKRYEWIGGRLSQLSPRALPNRKEGPQRVTVSASVNTDRFAPVRTQRLRFSIKSTNSLEPCIDELEVFTTEGVNVALAGAGAAVTFSGSNVSPDRHEPRFINDGLYGNERSWMSSEAGAGWVEVQFAKEEAITRVVWGRDRLGKYEDRLATDYLIQVAKGNEWVVVADASDRKPFVAGMDTGPEFTIDGLMGEEMVEVKRLIEERHSLTSKIKQAEGGQLAFAGKFRTPDKIYRLLRGDPEQPKEEVLPAVLSAFGQHRSLSSEVKESQRRVALAEWIANPQNPLTARVMVNRLWQGHFGTGLVATPSDFGHSGLRPTHPELLDWLAREFIRSGWSVKHMHRLIVLSQTYQQSSASMMQAAEKDVDVRFLWRFPSRRLEAESIRDSMLAVCGQLNVTMFGPGFDLFKQRGGLSGFTPVETLTKVNQRRMIYAHKVRRESEAVFGAFDCPDAGQSTAVRRISTTPVQALNLLNSRFTLQVAEAFAQRIVKEIGEDPKAQIIHAYEVALARKPSADEITEAEPIIRSHGLASLCRAMFNSNEFLFVP